MRNDFEKCQRENKKVKGWSKDEQVSETFDKTIRKLPLTKPSNQSSTSQCNTSQLPAMRTDSHSTMFKSWPSYDNTSAFNSQASNSNDQSSMEVHNPATQTTNRQLTPINEHRNTGNHSLTNYGSRHSIANSLNGTKTNLLFNVTNQKSIEEDAANYSSTTYRYVCI